MCLEVILLVLQHLINIPRYLITNDHIFFNSFYLFHVWKIFYEKLRENNGWICCSFLYFDSVNMDLVNEDKIKLSSKAAGNVNIYKCISKLELIQVYIVC